LELAATRIRTFHEQQRQTTVLGGGDMYLRPTPIDSAGCYVPGGRAAYPSTVLMTALPARVAGVQRVVITSPPAPDGGVHPLVAAAAHLCEVDEVRAIGGAQAIAALAYGTESIDGVDIIVGPGNIFVTLAKQRVFGTVAIDGLAGPSEILVIASDGANAAWVASDLVSQLEHDPLAWAVCITDSDVLADGIAQEFAEQAAAAARSGIIDEAAGRHGCMVRCADMDHAVDAANRFAPEHLELQGDAAEALVDRIRCAGAIFVGGDNPVPIGDYIAGPNHTLPTGGAARYGGPLSVLDFLHWPSVTRLSRPDLLALADAACVLAEHEGLHGHAAAIRQRTRMETA
jgi:histidinol dehydrogenase